MRSVGFAVILDDILRCDEVIFYKRVLTPAERAWLYHGGAGRRYADLTAPAPASYTYDTNHKHAVTALSTGESYSYDANGNMTCRVENGITYKQEYNYENLLSAVHKMNGNCTTGTIAETTSFVYDGDGNLVKKINPGGSRTLYIGGIYEVDKDANSIVTRTVTYYPAGGAMRIVDSTGNNLYYVLKDHLGSASVVTDDDGDPVAEQRYYPYGESRLTATMLTDKLFTGQRDVGLGIYHYGARFYSHKTGRFLSPDTIIPVFENPQSWNRFSYGLNNPSRYTDPTGHVAVSDTNEAGCSGGGPACIMDMWSGYDDADYMMTVLRNWVRYHLDYNIQADAKLSDEGKAIVAIAAFQAAIEDKKPVAEVVAAGGALSLFSMIVNGPDDRGGGGLGGLSRSLDDILNVNDTTFVRWATRKFPVDQPYSAQDATKIWNRLKEAGLTPILDEPHPGRTWDVWHINVRGKNIHIPVDPGFVPPP
ncbi:MAG TPA: RHS repeat-associated core domain-containing protein [Anaerolineales bacterium]|nr:RHS repeat-associated core domain-containing protein [Anaerolineales bacterium]